MRSAGSGPRSCAVRSTKYAGCYWTTLPSWQTFLGCRHPTHNKTMNRWLQEVLDQLGVSKRARKRLHIKAERAKMSTKLWWRVLKRDNFTCHYCGRRPPAVK